MKPSNGDEKHMGFKHQKIRIKSIELQDIDKFPHPAWFQIKETSVEVLNVAFL